RGSRTGPPAQRAALPEVLGLGPDPDVVLLGAARRNDPAGGGADRLSGHRLQGLLDGTDLRDRPPEPDLEFPERERAGARAGRLLLPPASRESPLHGEGDSPRGGVWRPSL